jgi:hypothetical protein
VTAPGEKGITTRWQNPITGPTNEIQDLHPSALLRRALLRKEHRLRLRDGVINQAGSTSRAQAQPDPVTGPTPANNQERPRRAASLSGPPGGGAQLGDLSQRLVELGPIPEVLEALQNILRNDNTADTDLPQYDEGNRRVVRSSV